MGNNAPKPHGVWHDDDWLKAAIHRVGNESELARELGVSRTTINVAVQKMRSRSIEHPPLVPRENHLFAVSGDVLLTSDWHVPMVRYDILQYAIDEAKKYGIKRAIIVGDFMNNDALANHERKQSGAGLDTEWNHADAAISALLEAMDEVIVARGNHDRHKQRQLRDGINFDRALRSTLHNVDPGLISKMKVTERDRVDVRTHEGKWMCAHTYSYSRDNLKYPMRLAVRHNMHVAAGHRHHHGVGYAPNGKMAMELGGLFDQDRMQYTHEWTNDLPEMMNGFALLIDGKPRLPMLTG